MSKTESERRRMLRTPARALLLVGVSVTALATSNASAFARPLNSGTGSPSVAAAAAAAAAAANRQNQQAAQQTRDTLSRVTRAVQSMRDIQDRAREAARTRPTAVPNGLGKGGLNPAVKAPKAAELDPTGMETWDGAKMPTETIKDGLHTVTIEQTDSRAILSWKTFNVGKDTTLVFDQDGNKDWVVLNRVVGGLDENGRRTAALDPTKILGSIKADGTVLIMNQNGVIFGAGAQIRTNSLVATTAEIGRGFRFIGTPDPTNRLNNEFEALTLVERNLEFMQNGLLGVRDSLKTDIERDVHSEFMPYFDDVVLANGRRDVARENDAPTGGVFVEAGAEIQLGAGGFALLNSTRVENAGRIVAPEANVSLVAAWGASLIASNGTSADGNNPYYRGVMGFDPTGRITPGFDGSLTYTDADGVIRKVNDDLGEVYSRNTGIIEAPRGAIRLIENAGVLLSTTSVSRNGYIAIDRAMPGSVTSILADTDPETIPLDRESIANFKASRIEIGYYVGADALVVAPGGDVVFGPPVDVSQNGRDIEGGQRVLVESGAIIDVAGLTDVIVPASRNAIQIGPLKGNELADSPGLRDSFLDGATIYVDPRKSGVREDGVAWIGSPLVDAASYYAQVGVTASELLTKGGNVTFATLRNSGGTLSGRVVSDTIVESGAVIDISGGSVRYQGGAVRTTSLVGADGRIYDISQADPLKMSFVGFAAGFTQYHERWGVARSYNSPLRPNTRMEREYDEGRDAGTLDLPGDVLVFEGSVKAGVIIGDRQRVDAREGTGSGKFDWDQRLVQGAGSELPVAGAIRIGGDLSGGSDVKIVSGDDMPMLDGPIGYGRDFGVIDATSPTTENGEAHGPIGPRDKDSALSDDRIRTTYISADMLNEAGFGQIEIARGGDITVEKKASVTLADGGLFTAASGGSIRVDGSITAASGVVALETIGNDALQTNFDLPRKVYSPYDIVVNGTISVRGKWVNDFRTADGKETGGAHLDGGSIVLFAGQAVANTGSGADPTLVRDISGSVIVNAGATLDVSGGGRVDRNGDIDVSAKGGNLALISEVNYLSGATEFPGVYVRSQHVNGTQPIVPDEIIAKVAIDAGATVLSHGFGGGGTFQLVTPEFSFGEKTAKVGTALSMDFISEQGFQNYDITSYKTKIVESKFRDDFDPGRNRGYDAFLDTQTITIEAGETLRLRNSVFSLLPSDRSGSDIASLKTLASGGDLYSVLSPTTLADTDGRDNAYYRQPVNLSFGGSIELKVAEGGKLIGEAGAKLTTPRLINEGLIRLPGGAIIQRATLPQPIAGEGRAVRDPHEGLVAEADGTYRESRLSDVTNANGRRLTNGEAYVGYLLGELAADVGVELRDGSVTDLGGVSLRDPLAHDGAGQKISDGRILSGGSITMAPEADRVRGFQLFPDVDHSRFAGNGYKDNTNFKKVLGLKLVAEEGSRLNLSGAQDVYQRPASGSSVNVSKLIETKVWSDAGGIYASNGATLTGADIDAHGGASQARGGVLEIGNLVLTQTDTETPLANTVSADMITRSGFDLLHARGSVDTIGDVDLTLGRAFFLTSRDIIDQTGQGAIRDPQLYANVGAEGALSISADYVRLEGYSQTVGAAPQATGTGSVTFSAGQIDVVGGVRFDESVGSATLDATGDVRLVGQSDVNRRLPADAIGSTILSDAIGMHLAVGGDLMIRASRVYPATGTTALVTSSGAASTIRFERAAGSRPTTPYSAGADLKIQAAHIQQNGALFVPHGSLTLGSNEAVRGAGSNVLAPVTETVTLGAGSLTSVSGGSIRIPYGVTTDLTEYYFTPGGDDALDQTPEKRLTLGGGEVVMEDGAKIDVSGGGDLFAYEFIPGTGGSRDVLDRLNVDQFSSNDGLTYPDGRQVYAIVPGLSDDAVAAFDPYFSSGYDALGRPSMAGTRVYLEGGKGIKAGWYTLLPAKYAVLPGGLRIVEQPGGPGLYSTGVATLADGTIRVSGRYGQFGSSDWRWRRFDVQTQSTFLNYSNIALTSAQATFAARAADAGEATPLLPLDAGSLTFDARTKLSIDGVVDSTPGKSGRGVTVDVGGSAIYVVSDPTAITLRDGTVLADGAVVREIDGRMVLCSDAASACAAGSKERLSDVAPLLIAADDLTGLGAESLLIGGTRAAQSDGTTEIRTTAYRLVVANDETSVLAAPEILLAVGVGQNELVDATGQPVDPNSTAARVTRDVRNGPAKALIIADGAVIEARGEVRDQSTADYVAAGGWVGRTYSATDPGSGFRRSTAGAFLRVANGPERIIRRDDVDLDAPENATSRPDLIEQYERRYAVDLAVGSGALLSGTSVLADVGTYRNPTLSTGTSAWSPKATLSIDAASIRARTLTLGAGEIALTDGAVDRGVLAVSHDFLDGLRGGGASRLNLLSRDVIGIDGGVWSFGELALTTPGVESRDGGDVSIEATKLEFGNSVDVAEACSACGSAKLSVKATEIVFGEGQATASGFGGGVFLTATQGLFAHGEGGLDVGASALTIDAPVIADRAYPRPDQTLTTIVPTEMMLRSAAAVRILNTSTETVKAFERTPGAILRIEGDSVSVEGTRISASAGMIDLKATGGDVRLASGATVEAPGYEKAFADVIRSAPAGGVRIQSNTGDVFIGQTARVAVGGAVGKAGALALVAQEGNVVIRGDIDGTAKEGDASILVDTGGRFDLDAFAALAAAKNFDGRVAVFSGAGDLTLGAGSSIRAASLTLGADGGAVDIFGKIDTTGVNGGDVSLFGQTGVRLRDGSLVETGATGYAANDSRRAKSGSVTIAVGADGRISLDQGSTIDVAADRDDARLVPVRREGQTYYYYVAADQGGSLNLRAPVIEGDAGDRVDVAANGRVIGAHEIVLEAYKTWDLDAIADSGDFVGVSRDENGKIVLDVREGLDTVTYDSRTGRKTIVDAGSGVNLLGDTGASTVASYIQDFDLSASFAALGDLAKSGNFHSRPGVELTAKGDVTFASNWNLAAGVVDVDAALADGVMYVPASVGKAAVMFGREADLISNYTAMTYRVGGSALGEAGAISIRTGGDLTVSGTISDGFFQFRNQTDDTFLAAAMSGQRPETAPYSAEANSAAAIGKDAAGSMELFPLIDGEAMGSFSLNFAAGADLASADTSRTIASADGDFSVVGLNSYTATSGGTRPSTRTAYYRNLIRTGAGSIEVAAAGSIDLRGEEDPVFVRTTDDRLVYDRKSFGDPRQIGGAAIYSAGRRVNFEPITVTDASGRRITLDTTSLLPTSNSLREGLSTFTYAATSATSRAFGPAGVLVGDLAFAEEGGDVTLTAGLDVLGRRDLARSSISEGSRPENARYKTWSSDYEPWRQGQVGQNAAIRTNASGFYDGVGALAGGDVTVAAGRDVSDLNMVSTTSLASAATSGADARASKALLTLGSGDVFVSAGRDILGGRVDVASGEGLVTAARSVASAGDISANVFATIENALRVRLSDAEISVSAGQGVDMQGIAALGAYSTQDQNSLGFYTARAGVSIDANSDVLLRNDRDVAFAGLSIWPGSFHALTTGGDLELRRTDLVPTAPGGDTQILMAPSPIGQLELLAAGDIAPTTLAMSDADPGLLPGLFGSSTVADFLIEPEFRTVEVFAFPNLRPDASESEQRRQHSETPLHGDDDRAALISAGRDISGVILSTPKETRVSAGRDILDMVFFGQNLDVSDVTRIVAGRDIIASSSLTGARTLQSNGQLGQPQAPRATLQGNVFVIGGPGSFYLEAGRNAGPFLTSATVTPFVDDPNSNDPAVLARGPQVSFGGGVMSVGDEYNPWLGGEGADVTVMFGVGKGVAWTSFRDAYLDPANFGDLESALFVGGDRSRPVYGPKLIAWLKENAPREFEAATGSDTPDYASAYAIFKGLSDLRQRGFISEVYFGELAATSDPSGASFQQYQRGYRAVNTLFPGELGYTKNDLTGGSNGANEQIRTGDLDLRLATIQTSRGGDVRLFGPGGRVLAGSVVRTAQQIARRNYNGASLFEALKVGAQPTLSIDAIPSGYEGLLTVRGGSISTFTDGDVLLNQSRLFTQGGGDIIMWSSNGDLNGGEGPKTSSNFPPVVVNTDYNGFSIEDRRGSATGAGIAAFQPSADVDAPDIFLIAPRGTVDAGAAGIRVAGNINVAAQTVANADNIAVGGTSVGVPSVAAGPIGGLTTNAGNEQAAQTTAANENAASDQASIIIVEVLGYGGGEGQGQDCPPDQPDCKAQPQ